MRHGDRFHTEEHHNLVKSRKVRDEVRENGGDPRNELGMNEPDPANPHDAKSRSQAEEPIDRDLVLNVKLILLYRPVVPHKHDNEKDARKGDRDPRTFTELYQRCREVKHFY
ncbi:hypothetical protein Ccrd_019212 [Cynara cardunculus var. scolymus]|uniref:Uncharacterized protein n=1 Tax=Cynara cardunculus var. scolymus TaxID=59895 RepID=A0A103Y4W5_CYNCS|nr:hypothetical protein Ccrd_019212 [Cynara cardunculus var. scolymus]